MDDATRPTPSLHRALRDGPEEILDELPMEDATLRYAAQGKIGRGGSSTVFRMADRALLRNVAVKVLAQDLCEEAEPLARFIDEARVIAFLEHPNIAPLYSLARDPDGRPYLTMKLVEGETLGQWVARLGPARLQPEHLRALVGVLLRVCDAVAYAHSRGVLHRDIKPSNIMVGAYGQVYLMDWGTAAVLPHAPPALRTGLLGSPIPHGIPVGPPQYMPPEQARGDHKHTDPRADVFALGATLYAVLAGRPPYAGESVEDLIRLAKDARVPSPEQLAPDLAIPATLRDVALRAMAKDPADRHADVIAFQQDLEHYLLDRGTLPTRAAPAGTVLVREGEHGDTAYILLEGTCEVLRGEGEDEELLRVLGPGEVFGETAVLLSRPRTATVRAKTDVTVVVVDATSLQQALGVQPWVGPFVRALAERFRDIDDRLRAARAQEE